MQEKNRRKPKQAKIIRQKYLQEEKVLTIVGAFFILVILHTFNEMTGRKRLKSVVEKLLVLTWKTNIIKTTGKRKKTISWIIEITKNLKGWYTFFLFGGNLYVRY